MLNVNTLPNRKDEEIYFDVFSVEIWSKRIGRREKYFKTNALVPKKAVLRKEEGAAVDSSAILPYLFSAGCALFRRAVGQ